MKKFKLFIFFVILLLFSNMQNCIAFNLCDKPFRKKTINKEIIEKVKFIRKDIEIKKEIVFFDFFFYQKNDSIFLDISYDFGPPYIMSDEIENLGFIVYKNNALIFMNEQISHELICHFINIKKLNKDIEYLREKLSRGHCDGETYVFYINELKELVFLRKYRY